MAGKELSLELVDVEVCVGWNKFWSGGWKEEITVTPSAVITKRFHHCRLGWDSLFCYLRNQANTFLPEGRGCVLSARPSLSLWHLLR